MEVNDKYEFNEVDTTFLVCQLTTQSNGRVIWQMESPHPNPPSFKFGFQKLWRSADIVFLVCHLTSHRLWKSADMIFLVCDLTRSH